MGVAIGTIFIATDFVLDPSLDAAAAQLQARGHRVIRGPKALPGRHTLFERADHERYFGSADVMVISTRSVIDNDMLDAAKRLRGIVFPSIGTESLDLNAASERGLLVAHGATPENFNGVAEATIMLMLALFYDLHAKERLLRANAPRPRRLGARMLQGKTVGIVGFGRIGRGVAARLQAWGVTVLACDPRADAAAMPPGATLVDMDALLASSDVVSVHTTADRSAGPIIGKAELQRMKSSAFLINTARGSCVDEHALYAALRARSIAGAALDAFGIEPLPPDSPLRSLDNVILTPHMVGHTQELFESFTSACVENVQRMLDGIEPLYIRNPEALARWRERLHRLRSAATAPALSTHREEYARSSTGQPSLMEGGGNAD